MVEKVTPWVAAVTTQSLIRGFFQDIINEGDGSAIIVRSDGYLATNNHVIAGASEIKVHLNNGETYSAQIVGRDEVSDLAVIKINASDLPTAVFEKSDDLRVGDWVVSIGNALGLEGSPTVALGIVSALGRTINTDRPPFQFYGLIQTDALINKGSSGGPLVNVHGNVVGISQAILREARDVGFAISASTARPIIDKLIEDGRVVRPLIGFRADTVTPAVSAELNLIVEEGVIVTLIDRNSPAYEAGIRVGDVVTEIDGVPVPNVAGWLQVLWSYGPQDRIQVEYVHNNQVFTTTVELAERPL